jgi:hypothetical protein
MATLDSKIKTSRIRTTALILLALVASSTVPASAAVLPAITSGNWSTISTTWGVGALAITPPTSTSTGEWTYVSRNTGVASVVGSVLSINGVGATTSYLLVEIFQWWSQEKLQQLACFQFLRRV